MMLIIGQTQACVGAGVYEKSMYLPLNFVINLKLLFKKACFFFSFLFLTIVPLLWQLYFYISVIMASLVAQLVKNPPVMQQTLSSIPVLQSFPGEGIGHPLQYSWVSLVAQTVKNPPAMWEPWVRYLGWEDHLEEGMATHSSILVWRIPWTEEPGRLQSMGLQRVGHN